MGRHNIKDLTLGQSLRELYLVKSKRKSTTKQGKTYLDLELQDKTGIIKAKVWDDADRADEECRRGDVIKVEAVVEEFNRALQLKVKRLRRAEPEEADLAELLPATDKDPGAMLQGLRERIAAVQNPHLHQLLDLFFADHDFVEKLSVSAAARNLHHGFRGGLLEHIYAMVRIADWLVENIYPALDRDLVLAGTILHDVGKITELNSDLEISYTREGFLQGHISLGLIMIHDQARTLPDFPPELLLHLEHIVLSHHGEHEWGSPVLPATPEAMLIHHVDNLDAKTTMVLEAIKSDKNLDEEFTEYHRALERHFYKVRPAAVEGTDEG